MINEKECKTLKNILFKYDIESILDEIKNINEMIMSVDENRIYDTEEFFNECKRIYELLKERKENLSKKKLTVNVFLEDASDVGEVYISLQNDIYNDVSMESVSLDDWLNADIESEGIEIYTVGVCLRKIVLEKCYSNES